MRLIEDGIKTQGVVPLLRTSWGLSAGRQKGEGLVFSGFGNWATETPSEAGIE